MPDSTNTLFAPLTRKIHAPLAEVAPPRLPEYMVKTYNWAYINPLCVALLDHNPVVWAILWGNRRKLMNASFSEIAPGQRVLQAAHVYGSFVAELARLVGRHGRLDVVDVVPIQVRRCRSKLAGMPHTQVRLADAAYLNGARYDVVNCYFLLHEIPDQHKRAVVNTLLAKIEPGGKVVFVDYHLPHPNHPLRGIMNLVFRWLEPYAAGLIEREIADFSDDAGSFLWRKRTYFGGLYQKVVAERPPLDNPSPDP